MRVREIEENPGLIDGPIGNMLRRAGLSHVPHSSGIIDGASVAATTAVDAKLAGLSPQRKRRRASTGRGTPGP